VRREPINSYTLLYLYLFYYYYTLCLYTVQVLFVAFDKAWILGAALCKLLLYGQIVTLACTTFILTSMSLDRYLAICHPLGSATVSRSRPKLMIAVSWLLAFIFASPQLAIFTQVRKPSTSDVHGRRGRGGLGRGACVPQTSGKIFLGNVKLGHFVHFSGKYHIKFGHFVNFSCIYFRAKMSCPPKLTEILRL